MKIVNKIILLVVVSVISIMGVVSVIASRQTEKIVAEQVGRALDAELDLAANEVENTKLTIQRIANVIARDQAIRSALGTGKSLGIGHTLNDLIAIYPIFNYAIIADLDGKIFAISTAHGADPSAGSTKVLGRNIDENPLFTTPSPPASPATIHFRSISASRSGPHSGMWHRSHRRTRRSDGSFCRIDGSPN